MFLGFRRRIDRLTECLLAIIDSGKKLQTTGNFLKFIINHGDAPVPLVPNWIALLPKWGQFVNVTHLVGLIYLHGNNIFRVLGGLEVIRSIMETYLVSNKELIHRKAPHTGNLPVPARYDKYLDIIEYITQP